MFSCWDKIKKGCGGSKNIFYIGVDNLECFLAGTKLRKVVRDQRINFISGWIIWNVFLLGQN